MGGTGTGTESSLGVIQRYGSGPRKIITPQVMYFLEGGLLMVGNLLKTDAWVHDEVRTHCNVCVQQFLPFRRRHHCRTCGEVVCGGCSSHRSIRLTDVNVECSTRICTFCVIRATDASIKANEDASRETLTDRRRLSCVSIMSSAPQLQLQAPAYGMEHARRGKQLSMLSMESELTTGSVVQLWPPPVLADEAARLQMARHTAIRSTENDPTMNLLVNIVARTLECPTALLALLDTSTLWVKASVGWDDRGDASIPRDDCICAHTLKQDATMIVADAATDKHFHGGDLLVAGRPIRYYAGAPVRVRGHCIGVVCVLDGEPHAHTTASMRSTLEAVANIVSEVLEQRVDSSDALFDGRIPGSMEVEAHNHARTSDGVRQTSRARLLRSDSTPVDLHASLSGLNLLPPTRQTSASATTPSGRRASGLSSSATFLSLPTVPQEYGDKISMAMDVFHRLQSSYWTEREMSVNMDSENSTASSIKTFETFQNGRIFTKSNTKLSGTCADVLGFLADYDDARVYRTLLSRVTRRYKLSDQAWMDDMTFHAGVHASESETQRVLSHWRQYPDGSNVVVALSGTKLYEADERDLLFGWFVAPCSLDDGLGTVNVSCITAQPYENQSHDQNLSCELLERLGEVARTQSRPSVPNFVTSMEPPSPLPMLARPSFEDNQFNHERDGSFIFSVDCAGLEDKLRSTWDSHSTADADGSIGSNSVTEPSAARTSGESRESGGSFPTSNCAALVSLQHTGQLSQLNENERMMLDLLDKTISTQEILAQQQNEMASVIDRHGTQLQRISTAIERVETLLADGGDKLLKRAGSDKKGSMQSLR